ncbi:hypothetical protein A3F03_00660 [Candidatus Roizmanbacteria bacterium RIFCSPHIGHO2_12_FULL_41_11]|uniref:HD domain-containing protein n=1 Tax=Candidatus Roizmanbacteria bacterium RIFCSPHIGHO2_12_FULL_41_11 TaxID=1802052 RepID=A0A1F7I0D8_9BACT|nr:MAG: hypothetical protein A3F03_00660 [Candidatus Roizmanbacteria bacterium RIFCSPHIGHO2_12_FULL_41_11]
MTDLEKSPNYRPPVSDSIRAEYERGLAKILRWENGFLPTSKKESDLDHVRDMLLILEDIQQRFMHIPNEVNFTTVSHMIYIHDAGEILAGDLAHTHPYYTDLKPKVKKREIAAFRLLSKSLEDEATKTIARDLYRRVHGKSPDDKEARLTDFIDKAQAVRFGLINVFPAKNLKTSEKRKMQLNHAMTTILKPADGLVRSLESPYSRIEAIELIEEELGNFLAQGYKKHEIQPYFDLFSTFPTNSVGK